MAPENHRPAPTDLSRLSYDDLRRELDRRERELHGLVAKREKLTAALTEIDAQIQRLQGNGNGATATAVAKVPREPGLALPRPKNSINLPDAIALEAEPGQVVTPTEIAKRVLARGYQTTAAKFAMVVANALSKDKRFKRIGRGQYERLAAQVAAG